jgi:WD40 repeat protein
MNFPRTPVQRIVLAILFLWSLVLMACTTPQTEVGLPTILDAEVTTPEQLEESRTDVPPAPTRTPTQIPTLTPTDFPTETPTTTATPTPDLPVRAGTPWPVVSVAVNEATVSGIRELARYGTTHVKRIVPIDDIRYAQTGSGLDIYQGAEFVNHLDTFDPVVAAAGSRFVLQGMGKVAVFESDSSVRAAEFAVGSRRDTCVAISPDGTWLAIGQRVENGFKVYDIATRDVVHSGHGWSNLAFTNGLLAVHRDRSWWFWDTNTWEQKQTLWLDEEGRGFVSHRGHYAAILRTDQVEVWEIAERQLIRTFSVDVDPDTTQVRFYPNEQYLAIIVPSFRDIAIQNLSTFEIETGRLIGEQEIGPYDEVLMKDSSETQILLAADYQAEEINPVAIQSGTWPLFGFFGGQLETLNSPFRAVNGSTYWQLPSGNHQVSEDLYPIFSAGLVELGHDDSANRRIIFAIDGVVFSEDDRTVSAEISGNRLIWSGFASIPPVIDFNQGQVAFGLYDQGNTSLVRVDLAASTQRTFTPSDRLDEAVAFDDDGNLIYVASDSLRTAGAKFARFYRLDQDTGESALLYELPVFETVSGTFVSSLVYHAGLLFVGLQDGSIHVINLTEKTESHWRAHTSPVRGLAVSADGTRVASAGDEMIKIWGIWP